MSRTAEFAVRPITAPFLVPPAGRRRAAADRIVALFTSVRTGEGLGALLLAANVFLLLAAYYMLKTVREALILSEGGAEVKSYSSAGQALLLLVAVPAYGWLASRVNRMRLVASVTLFFIANLAGFFLLAQAGVPIGVPFFIWVGVFNVAVIAQFWSFASDVYTEDQGKRLMPVIAAGSTIGALAGAKAAGSLFVALGPYGTLLAAAAVLAGSLALTGAANRRFAQASSRQKAAAERPLAKRGGFQMILTDRYLLLIAAFVLLLNVVNTTGEFLLGKLVVEQAGTAADKAQFIGRFYADYFTWVGLLAAGMQILVVPRVVGRIGVRLALFIVPCLALGGYSLLAAMPLLAVVRVAKIIENSADYSLQNTARHALFLNTSREAKYKAKAAIDTFFWRAGDVAQAGLVLLGSQLGLSITQYARINALMVAVWIGVVALLYREGRRRKASSVAYPAPAEARKAG